MIYYSDLLPDDRVRIAILFGKNRPEDELEFADYLDQLKIPWTTVNMWVFDGEFISIPVWSFKHLTRHTLRKAISAILYITRNPDCYMEYSGFPLLMSNLSEHDKQCFKNRYLDNLLEEYDIAASIEFLPTTTMIMEELFFGRAAGIFDDKGEDVLAAVNKKISDFMNKFEDSFRGRDFKILY